MKVFGIVFVFFSLLSFTQKNRFPVKALYAYKQEIKKGVNDGKKRPAVYKYRIFLEKWSGQNFTVNRLWIDGKERLFETSVIATPVLHDKAIKLMNRPQNDTLVQATANEVLEIQATHLKENGIPVLQKMKGYEILIEYTSGDKTFFLGNKAIKLLSPQIRK